MLLGGGIEPDEEPLPDELPLEEPLPDELPLEEPLPDDEPLPDELPLDELEWPPLDDPEPLPLEELEWPPLDELELLPLDELVEASGIAPSVPEEEVPQAGTMAAKSPKKRRGGRTEPARRNRGAQA